LHPASVASRQESCGPDEDDESDELTFFVIFVHACLKTGFITVTSHLNIEVAVRVAATDTTAVVAAVVKTIPSGTGTSISVYGTRTVGTGGVGGLGFGLSDSVVPLTPGGARRSLGGTTSGLYEGKSARGTSSTGRGKTTGSGSLRDGNTGGSPKSIIC